MEAIHCILKNYVVEFDNLGSIDKGDITDELHAMTTAEPLTGPSGTIAAWSRTNRIFISVDLWKITTQ